MMHRMLVVIVAAALAGCGGKGGGNTSLNGGGGDGGTVDVYFAQVASDTGAIAQLRSGSLPAFSAGPTVLASADASAITGGSKVLSVYAQDVLSGILIAVEGASGYYELATSDTSTTVVLTFGQSAPTGLFTADVIGVDASGHYGAVATVPFSITQVGTGAVQVSVSWDQPTDVDLHVVAPTGDEIYYGNTEAAGGVLDLDSNAGCAIDNVDNENITWPEGAAPSGTYIVRVDYYDACSVAETNYVVTVRVAGKAPQTFSGTLSGDGDGGSEGSGIEITRFNFP